VTQIIIIYANDKKDVLSITEKIPNSLQFKYFVLVSKPGVTFEPTQDLTDRLTKQADHVLEKLKKSVQSYVG